MKKYHTYNELTVNGLAIVYFYNRLKNDINGNARYKVFIIIPEIVILEKIFKCYEFEIDQGVETLVNDYLNN